MMKPVLPHGGPAFPPFQHEAEVRKIVASQNNFTRDLYMTIIDESSENLFFSPFSIMAALAMTHVGTGGKTEEEINKALYLPSEKEIMIKAMSNLIADIKSEKDEYELRTSNMAYLHHSFVLLDEYSRTLTEKFLSTSESVNFADSENVRHRINEAIAEETNYRIKNLLPPGSLNALTRFVLVNAVYFKGLWEQQFDKANTSEKSFYITADQAVKTPMMSAHKEFKFALLHELDANALCMDYKGSRLSMVFVLPNKVDGLSALESKLSSFDFTKLDSKCHSMKIRVSIPKFKMDTSLGLVPTLKKMGINDLFSDNNCDFSKMSSIEGLYVSNIFHRAFLEVNEEGSEAAAATAVVIMTRAMIREPPSFIADHPFFFFIRDRHSGLILFAGRYMMPSLNVSKEEL